MQRVSFFGGGALLLTGACTKPEAGTKGTTSGAAAPPAPRPVVHKTLSDEEFAIMSAAVERVLPKDEDPGAIDAGVPNYVDAMLANTEMAKSRADFVPGLHALNRRCKRMFQTDFVQATDAQRDEVLTVFKNSPDKSGEARWYDLLLALTLEGYLGDPSYGGNRNRAGWALVGFRLVGGAAANAPTGYQGSQHLHHTTCGGGRGC